MKRVAAILAALALAAGTAAAWVVSYDLEPATNGAAYRMPVSWVPATATAWGTTGTVTVARVHRGMTNTLGTVAAGATNASLSWGALVRGDTLVLTGPAAGCVEIQGQQ